MKTYWGLLAVAGTLAFLILFLADRERQAGVERLSGHHSAIESPDLCKEPGCNTYMRNYAQRALTIAHHDSRLPVPIEIRPHVGAALAASPADKPRLNIE